MSPEKQLDWSRKKQKWEETRWDSVVEAFGEAKTESNMLYESSQRRLQCVSMRDVEDKDKRVVAGHSYDKMKLS